MIRILIIEKDPRIQEVITALCQREPRLFGKKEIIISSNLEEAKKEINPRSIDLIIVDIKTYNNDEQINRLCDWVDKETPVVCVDSRKELSTPYYF